MLTLESPAKINYFLRVIRRRQDGYHDLATLMQALDLTDTLHFEKNAVDVLQTDHPTLPTNQDNLILKAAELFRRKTGIPLHTKIELIKRIPIEAGLGGGSGNAATTLWAYNELAGRPATNQQLLDWSAEIGSDIPFFFSTGTAHCTGRGEQVVSKPPLSLKEPLWIVKPDIAASTAKVYAHFKPQKTLAENCSNDLEAAAFDLYPELAELKASLPGKACMCGSGTAFFVLSETKPAHAMKVEPIQRELHAWYS